MTQHRHITDARGKSILSGCWVRVIGMPDLSDIHPADARRKTAEVFAHIQGRCKKVSDISANGYVELTFRIRSGENAGLHIVEIEPQLVLVQASRKP